MCPESLNLITSGTVKRFQGKIQMVQIPEDNFCSKYASVNKSFSNATMPILKV